MLRRLTLGLLVLAFTLPLLSAQPKRGKGIQATDPKTMKVAKDFKVELLYTVPRDKEGSWVCMSTLPGGKLIVSDQYDKGLYIVTLPKPGTTDGIVVEPLKLTYKGQPFGMAQGLCWAFDALYVVVNGKGSGLYKVTASKADGPLDSVELLRDFKAGGGEHGPHAVIKHPDGKRLTVVCGNQTALTEVNSSLVPRNWGDDHLLPRLPDGNGFMAGVLAPGGAIYNVTPDGQEWELQSVGYRNQYDAAYNRQGELFTYDADMEWDFNTPWYRPTRVCLAMPGADFGWRNGAGKYPAYYADNLPGICDIGPGSPTGVVFGYGAKFPAKYQNALFICDWSYGKMYAVHMEPDGSAYRGVAEEFVTGTPLALTDLVVGEDGALYFTTGGRRVQSGLYRVTYTGSESTQLFADSVNPKPKLEYTSIDRWVADLASNDRFTQISARNSLEMMDQKTWSDKVLSLDNSSARVHAALALVRSAAACPEHDKDGKRKGDPALRASILESLSRLDFAKLSTEQQLDLVRVYQVLFHRFGMPTDTERDAWLAKYEPHYPVGQRYVDGELSQLFVYLQSPQAAAKTVKLLQTAPTQEEQIEYARSLRMLKTGWTPELRKSYFEWFVKAQTYKGGNSFANFVKLIKADAIKTLTEAELVALKPIIDAKPADNAVAVNKQRPFVKKHTLEELAPVLEKGLAAGGRDFERGRKLFAATNCFGCHRFDGEGGSAGPDLSGIAGRMNARDLLETIIDPNKEVSDQYQAVKIELLDGRSVTGRIVNLNGDNLSVMPDMLNPNGTVNVNQKDVDSITPSKNSMMPAGLLDTLSDEEAIDLMAYLLSMGKRDHPVFKK